MENSIKALDDLTNVSRQFIFISTIMKNKAETIRFVFKVTKVHALADGHTWPKTYN